MFFFHVLKPALCAGDLRFYHVIQVQDAVPRFIPKDSGEK